MGPFIEQHRGRIVALCERYGIARLDVFGSAARADRFDPVTSDADFFYELANADSDDVVDRYFGFIEEMEALLGRPVDLATTTPRHANRYFTEVAERDRQTLYAARTR